MGKTGPRTRRIRERTAKEDVRHRIVGAAFETLREVGYAETSARLIAKTGGFNQAQIFYYFGSVNNLLVAAFEQSSLEQLAAYRETVAGITELSDLLAAVRERVEADLESGHVRVLAELIGASSTDSALRAKVLELFTPWIELTKETMTRVLAATGFDSLLPAERVAYGVVCLFLGMQQMVTLTNDAQPVLDIFETAQQVAGTFNGILQAT